MAAERGAADVGESRHLVEVGFCHGHRWVIQSVEEHDRSVSDGASDSHHSDAGRRSVWIPLATRAFEDARLRSCRADKGVTLIYQPLCRVPTRRGAT